MSIQRESSEDVAMRLRAVIDTAIDGIITIDRKGKIESINLAAAQLFQYSVSELLGKNISVLMPEPDHSNHDQYIHNYLESGHAKIIGKGREVTGLKKDKTKFPFNLAVSEVRLKDKLIFTGIIHDLTAVKKAQEHILELNEALELKVVKRTNELEEVVNELLKINAKLHDREIELKVALEKEKELNVLKSRFVSMASHEFRTPLSTILSSATLVSRYEQNDQADKRAKHIERIKKAVENMTGILNDFLSLSKLEEGKTNLQKVKINISDICEETLDSIQIIKKKDQQIIYFHKSATESIVTDKNILKNILFNLLSNAIKYSDEGSKIECHIESDANYTIFTVKDEGIGIPEAEQKFMYERFYRASNAENIQGTGLGLNIVKSYLDLLKGDIDFESIQGIGTTFKVRIPNAN
jgi:PAS domain S-box-containing protein